MKKFSPRAVSPLAIIFGLPAQKKVVFFRQLATMVNSGLPVGRAVSTASQLGLEGLGKEMANSIDQGASLSEAMMNYPYHFDKFESALVKAGESAGQLDIQLKALADNSEAQWLLTKKLTSKLVYPAVVAHGAVVLPPLFILVKSGLGPYLATVGAILVPAYILMLSAFLLYRFFRIQGGPSRMLDTFLSHVPILASPLRLSARIRFFDALSSLSSAGLMPNNSVPLAAEACGNYWLRDKVMEAFVQDRNSKISDVLRRSKVFGPMEVGLVSTGEEAGSFSDSLSRAADSLRPDFETQVHRITTILPVIMLFAVGGLVGFICIRSMTQLMGPIMNI